MGYGTKSVRLNLSKDMLDGMADGFNDVLGNYKNAGTVAKITRSTKSMAAFGSNRLYTQVAYQEFTFNELDMIDEMSIIHKANKIELTQKVMATKISNTSDALLKEALLKVNTGTVAHLARNEYEFSRMAVSHEAWHKIDLDNNIRKVFVSELKDANITISEKAEVSYYALVGGDGELFAEVGALYVSGRQDLIPRNILQVFEKTIKGLKL